MINKIRTVINDITRIQLAACICISIILFAFAGLFFYSMRGADTYDVDFSAVNEETDDDARRLVIRGISLPKGHYDIDVGYVASDVTTIEIALDNGTYLKRDLSPTAQEGMIEKFTFDIAQGTDRGRIELSSPAGVELNLAFIKITSDGPICYDGLIWGIIIILLIPGVWAAFYFYNHSTHKISLLITVGVVLIQIVPFLMRGGMPNGVDSQTHMMRIEGIYYGLLDGQFPVVVYPEWNNSYGQIGVLYPNIFLYIPALFRVIGMSQLGACKLFIFLVITVSAIIALASARTIFTRDWQINMCIVALTMEDIRLWDMMHRGRVQGSFLAEMFLPLVVAGLIEVFCQNRRKWHLLAFGVAGVFCCHVTSFTVMCIGIALFAIFAVKSLWKRRSYKELGMAILLFLALVLGTLVCFLAFCFEDYSGTLVWRDFMDMLWRPGGISDSHKWINVFGKAAICYAALIVAVIRKRFAENKGTFVFPMLAAASILMWMSTAAFPWALLRNIGVVRYYTDMLQSGDRFLNVAAVMLSFCLPVLVRGIRTPVIAYSAVAVMSLYSLVFNMNAFFRANDSVMYHDTVIGEIEVDSDDYLPAGTLIEWYRSDSGYISDEDAVESLGYERNGTHLQYYYTNTREGAYAEFPVFYYDGYVASSSSGGKVDVYKGERNRIRTYLKTTDKPEVIYLYYKVPLWMTIPWVFSAAAWIAAPMILSLRVGERVV